MTFYDVNAAIDKPNIVNSLRQGFMFGQQKREIEQQEADRNELRALAAPAASGDLAAQDRALAIDPQRGQQYAEAGDRRINQLRGYIDYVERARATGNPQQLNAALAAGSGFIGQLTGKPGPTAWSDDPAFQQGWEALKAKVAMGGPDQSEQDPAGFREAHMTAVAAGYQPGTPEYQKFMRVRGGIDPRAVPVGVSYVDEYDPVTGASYKVPVQTRGFENGSMPAGQRQPAPGPQAAPQRAEAPSPEASSVQAQLDAIGRQFGFETTSAVRSPEENAALPDASTNSQHVSGTARDYSVKGKTPEQIQALVSALQSQGFEVITRDHGTGPHVHAELPPQASPVANVAPAPAPAAAPRPNIMAVGGGEPGFDQYGQRIMSKPTNEQEAAQARRTAAASATGRIEGEKAAGPDFEQESSLRKEYKAAVGPQQDIVEAYQRVEGAARNPSAAGDLSMVFAYMKMLDPGSAVREGEFANAQNAAGIPDQVVNLYNRALSGTRLNPAQRADFLAQAGELRNQAQLRIDEATDYYEELAPEYGIDPKRIIRGGKSGNQEQAVPTIDALVDRWASP